jgi:hypothetical protein
MKRETDDYSEAEAERRRDLTLRAMLRTKPQPNWRPTDIAKDNRSRKRRKKAKASS